MFDNDSIGLIREESFSMLLNKTTHIRLNSLSQFPQNPKDQKMIITIPFNPTATLALNH